MPEQASESRKTPRILLVGGAMRSGTTVIHRALCTARNSNPYISESWFLHDLMNLYRWNLTRYEVRHADQFGDVRNFVNLIKLNFQYYIDAVSTKYENPEILILKHPELTRHFAEIGRMFPDIRFLVIVRDPRDVISSMKDVAAKHQRDGIVSPQSRLMDTEGYCRQYASYYGGILRQAQQMGSRLDFVRYEDVMRDRQCLTAKAAALVGAVYDPGEVGRFSEQHAASNNFKKELRLKDPLSGAFWSDLYTKDFSTDQIGRYSKSLDEAEVGEIERLLRPIGTRFRYWA